MKKKMFLLGFCILMVSTIMLGCFSASAATTTSSGSYVLSKTDQTEKKHTKSLSVSGGGSATVTAQHWKGSTFPTYSDTAYSKINSSKVLIITPHIKEYHMFLSSVKTQNNDMINIQTEIKTANVLYHFFS